MCEKRFHIYTLCLEMNSLIQLWLFQIISNCTDRPMCLPKYYNPYFLMNFKVFDNPNTGEHIGSPPTYFLLNPNVP